MLVWYLVAAVDGDGLHGGKQGSGTCQIVPDRARNPAHLRSLTVNEPSQRRPWSRWVCLGPSQA